MKEWCGDNGVRRSRVLLREACSEEIFGILVRQGSWYARRDRNELQF
jgi:hypothetical protein